MVGGENWDLQKHVPPREVAIPSFPNSVWECTCLGNSVSRFSFSIRSRYRINDPEAPHFITSTIVEWLPIFTTSACCDIVVRSLVYCRERKSLRIYGWVILDNHFHAIVAGPELARTIADLKKFYRAGDSGAVEARETRLALESTALLLRHLQESQRASGLAGGCASAVDHQRRDDAAKAGVSA